MSVWLHASSDHSPALVGSEGELISVSVTVEPRELEHLLEALAGLDFPINPEIYHDAAVVYVGHDGEQRLEPSTVVEFPAYAERLPKIRAVLETCGFPRDGVSVSRMLDEIHADDLAEPAPPGASYARRIVRKHATAAAAGKL
ncbi:MAG TPA: hypothetical protein VMT32_02260 [Bryobacteraceae bacterium]|nr:hypothetical protein [Bryobacteraceae bacterium]